MENRWRKLIRRLHPEGIPWPASILYNALSSTGIFLRHYALVADDVARYGPSERLIDIGTGPGQLLLALRRTLADTKLVGIDISPAMVAQARRHMKAHEQDPRIEVGVADASACLLLTERLIAWSLRARFITGSTPSWLCPRRTGFSRSMGIHCCTTLFVTCRRQSVRKSGYGSGAFGLRS